jgi:hypothetical protein
MHDVSIRRRALDLLAAGTSRREVCRLLGVGYNSTYRWEQRLEPRCNSSIACFRCDEAEPGAPAAFSYLLGQYLGDGHIRRSGRTHCLSVTCCTHYPAIAAEVEEAMRAVLSASVFRRGPYDGVACLNVESCSQHWLHLFPQHGPGRKHERPIVLEPWQADLVSADPRPLIRGLLHSDGCRVTNWTERRVGHTVKRYEYPRYLFSNRSADIHGIFTAALDQLGIAWRANGPWSISVARRTAVAHLDTFVGPKA